MPITREDVYKKLNGGDFDLLTVRFSDQYKACMDPERERITVRKLRDGERGVDHTLRTYFGTCIPEESDEQGLTLDLGLDTSVYIPYEAIDKCLGWSTEKIKEHLI
jgi:hypothetical protein